MAKKALIIIWVVFSISWSATMMFVFMLGAGMSTGDHNEGFGFMAYWFAPILIPYFIYRYFNKHRSRNQGTSPE